MKNYEDIELQILCSWLGAIPQVDDVTLIIGKVNHSYAVSSPPLHPWGTMAQ